MKSDSLTKQTFLLLIGRLLSMPVAFLVPIVLTRSLSLEEFGAYKQVFLVFTVLLPIIDLGVTNSLYYLIPKYPDKKKAVLVNTFLLQLVLSIAVLIVLALFKGHVSQLFTGGQGISEYMWLIGIFAVTWNVSNIIEVVFIVEKRSTTTAVFVFISEFAKSGVVIVVAFLGGGLLPILVALVCVGAGRLVILLLYWKKKFVASLAHINTQDLWVQIRYAVPFGLAVIINGFVSSAHQFIVSRASTAEEFAIFTIGCFQLPFLAVLIDSVAKTSIVRIAELRHESDANEHIASLIAECIRKIWLILFPVFAYFWVIAEPFIVLLFTEEYAGSVSVFKVFVFVIPVSALLVQHVLRAYSHTTFIMMNNFLCLVLSFTFCYAGYYWLGLVGVAGGYIFAQLVWKMVFIQKCTNILSCRMRDIIPLREMARISLYTLLAALPAYWLLLQDGVGNLYQVIIATILFGPLLLGLFWFGNGISANEKERCRGLLNSLSSAWKEKYLKGRAWF